MCAPRVLNKHHNPQDGVYIGRPSKWGNPFVVGRDGSREEVVRKYAEWLLTQPHLLASIGELTGKNLICFCAPKACHGDILLLVANPELEIDDGNAEDY